MSGQNLRIMLRRRQGEEPEVPEWEQRIASARALIEAQRPPAWIVARLDAFHGAVADAVSDRDRLRAGLSQLDVDRAARELKDALRSGRPGVDHERLVDSLRQRYESINGLHNRVEALDGAIDRALADIDVLAARSIGLGSREDAWRLDDSARRLDDDLTALERAHDELADL